MEWEGRAFFSTFQLSQNLGKDRIVVPGNFEQKKTFNGTNIHKKYKFWNGKTSTKICISIILYLLGKVKPPTRLVV